ncbi:4-hydroxy-tetrahydrodipicolinate reductase [Exiguobacterium sp. MMG028]|uniref:4-hydroxy-tetrahydrodipicolinate reductase n=1 Tax=Exiguobacterium sp. MMG028 TaxID=3021979 RepID=UPI0022FE55ED|nr:4-hydroxy-tetrahydrodipicolinate reductase [Exiguobacterium sp. MMG028]MDA5561665.1 4-hydroxy-tetrahydrodipicolinate reductase [Exiguobacterium sp. MMG028]
MNVLIHGFGAMGRIVEEVANAQGVNVSAIVSPGSDEHLASLDKVDAQVDVVIDFSNPALLPGLLAFGRSRNIPLVIATTGFTPEELADIEEASLDIPIFQSYNTSYGIALLKQLLDQLVPLTLGYDIEVIEAHHRKKVDAPSGTAELLARAIEAKREVTPIYERTSRREARGAEELGMHSIRGGTIFGEHTVLFAGDDEMIELKHTALSKRVFANGALAAAATIIDRPAGLYNLSNLYEEATHVTHKRL